LIELKTGFELEQVISMQFRNKNGLFGRHFDVDLTIKAPRQSGDVSCIYGPIAQAMI